jgi:hypothetical protein
MNKATAQIHTAIKKKKKYNRNNTEGIALRTAMILKQNPSKDANCFGPPSAKRTGK